MKKKLFLFFILIAMLSSCSILESRNYLAKDKRQKRRDNKGSKIVKSKDGNIKDTYQDQDQDKRYINKDIYTDLLQRFKDVVQENRKLKALHPSTSTISKISRAKNKTNQHSLHSIISNKKILKDMIIPLNIKENKKNNKKVPLLDEKVKSFEYISKNRIQKQINALNIASKDIKLNNFNKAIGILKQLEMSPITTIAASAKYLTGNIMFKQKEYDLSMQLFEEIINNYAESSLVLDSLQKLIICTKKLKLVTKHNKYRSLYHDLFGINKK